MSPDSQSAGYETQSAGQEKTRFSAPEFSETYERIVKTSLTEASVRHILLVNYYPLIVHGEGGWQYGIMDSIKFVIHNHTI